MPFSTNPRVEKPAGKVVEREFMEDLQILLRNGQIRDIQRNKALDGRGVDALVQRRDKKWVKINAMVDNERVFSKHWKMNRRSKDPMRKNILLWRHNSHIPRPVRMQDLLKAIEEHSPDAE